MVTFKAFSTPFSAGASKKNKFEGTSKNSENESGPVVPVLKTQERFPPRELRTEALRVVFVLHPIDPELFFSYNDGGVGIFRQSIL